MKNKLALVLVFCLVSVLAMCLVACNHAGEESGSVPTGLQIPDYTKPALNATYGQTLADVALPQGFTWDEPLTTSVGNAGEQTFHVTYTPEDTSKYRSISGIAVTVVVAKANFDMTGITFSDAQFTYDGQPHSLALTGTLPQGIVVYYENNDQADAGEYEVIAHFTVDGNHNAVQDMRATLSIIKSDIAGLSMTGATFTYDGIAHSITVVGTIPADVQVVYDNNYKVNAGTYDVVAHFIAGANYNNLPDLHATMTINKATVTGLSFADATYTYDGTEHSVEVTGTIPTGVSVSYTNNASTNAGQYIATATFTVNGNYNEIDPMIAILTINKADPVIETPEIMNVPYGTLLGNVPLINPTTGTVDPYLYWYNSGNTVYELGYLVHPVSYYNYDNENYNEVSDIPVTIRVYKNTDTLSVESERAIFYDAQKDITIRIVSTWQTNVSISEFDTSSLNMYIYAYAYKGRDFSDVDDATLNSNAESVKIDEVYHVRSLGEEGFTNTYVLETIYYCYTRQDVMCDEHIDYTISYDTTTHKFSFCDVDYGTLNLH